MNNWKAFTPEEVVSLRVNPYVKSVTTYMVRFTVEFKERVWDEFQNGRPMATIVADMGFDPEVFGASRLNGILQHIKDAVNSGEDLRDYRRKETLSDSFDGLPPAKALIPMQHEIAYMKQDLEFIKKSFWRTERQIGNAHPRKSRGQVRNHPRNDDTGQQPAQHLHAL